MERLRKVRLDSSARKVTAGRSKCVYIIRKKLIRKGQKKKTPTEGIFLRNSYPNFYAECLVASSFTSSTVSPEKSAISSWLNLSVLIISRAERTAFSFEPSALPISAEAEELAPHTTRCYISNTNCGGRLRTTPRGSLMRRAPFFHFSLNIGLSRTTLYSSITREALPCSSNFRYPMKAFRVR